MVKLGNLICDNLSDSAYGTGNRSKCYDLECVTVKDEVRRLKKNVRFTGK